ncbi:MAG TPA: acetate--CoA ligase family protein [Thermodesulfobacteriota bacterium]|nr:acetate--CoA ligase family protein [Thermodesulfobacteriota bacterium]
MNLDFFFTPKSVAIIGASNRKGSMGYVFMENITQAGYEGEIFPINPNEDVVFGLKAYRDIKDVPIDVDLAVVLVPAEKVPEVMSQCGEKEVKGAVVISSGFAEAGEEGARLQEKLVDTSKRYGIRVLGPNCFGLYNCNIGLNVSLALGSPERGGRISLVTQSGAYGMAIYTFALDHSMKFAKIIAPGNKCDLQDYEILSYLGQDPESKVICFLAETISKGREFFEMAREVTPRKPVILVKTGRTEGSKRAALSHTASLAGNLEAYRAAFRQAGIIEVRSGLEMIDLAKALDFQPLPHGKRVGIVTNSGGTGVELTDLLEESGLVVPELPNEYQDTLRNVLPAYASPRNPIDVTPLWSRFTELYSKSIASLFECPDIDIIIPILLQRSAMMKEVAEAVRDTVVHYQKVKKVQKPVYVCWVSTREHLKNTEILQSAGIPCYEWPERSARIVGYIAGYADYVNKIKSLDVSTTPPPQARKEKVKEILMEVSKENRNYVFEPEVKKILSLYGIRVTKERMCSSFDEAVRTANEIGYPVVLKVVSPDVVHKSDSGGVEIGIKNASQLEESYMRIQKNVQLKTPSATIKGILVQEMVKGKEVIIGSVRDSNFGPLMVFGMGGIFVEALRDVSYRLAPLTELESQEMIEEIKGYPLLRGYRGERGVDLEELKRTVMMISSLLVDFPEIKEMDLNPVFVNENEVIVADGRMFLDNHRD